MQLSAALAEAPVEIQQAVAEALARRAATSRFASARAARSSPLTVATRVADIAARRRGQAGRLQA